MITTVNSATALNAALRSAHAGDTIQLGAGTYSGVIAQDLHFAQDVTITSAGSGQAVLTGLAVNRSSGLNFSNLDFQVKAAGGDNPFQVNGSQDIHFDKLNVHGSMDGNPKNDVSGVLIRASSDVSIRNSEFQQLKNAIGFTASDHLTFTGNELHDLRADGIHGNATSWVTISGNSFHDFHSAAGDHSDAIQFWTSGATAGAHDITITDNLYMRGSGTAAQGVFLGDEVGNLHYSKVVIANNFIIGAQYNGIAVANPDGVSITDNTVIGFGSMKSWIRVAGGDGATITGNTTNFVNTTGQSHVTQSGTILVATATDAGAAAYQKWLALHAGGAPIGGGEAGDPPQTPPPTENPPTGAPPTGSPPAGLTLHGGAGVDVLTGGAGSDTITGGGGADLLTGRAGNDTFAISSKSTIVELASGGHDTVLSSASGFTLPANVEDLVLTAGYGIYGGGNGLDNRITGTIGGDHLNGNVGADSVDGGAGADFINGGAGADRLTGGAGADLFIYTGRDGVDVITDFGAGGAHDQLDLSALFAQGLRASLSQTSGGVLVSITGTDSILLQGVSLKSLHGTSTGYIF